MIGKFLAQVAVGIGLEVVREKVLPKVVEKARKKLDEIKAKKEEEDLDLEEKLEQKTKVYVAEWK